MNKDTIEEYINEYSHCCAGMGCETWDNRPKAKKALNKLINKKVKEAKIDENKWLLRVTGEGWTKEAQDLMSPIDRTWLKEELTNRISDLKTNRE